uniref:RNA helicase n=1 Tax=Panagrellus redivivus TaxID=6233 RepID=A0A7E4USL3_PANRE
MAKTIRKRKKLPTPEPVPSEHETGDSSGEESVESAATEMTDLDGEDVLESGQSDAAEDDTDVEDAGEGNDEDVEAESGDDTDAEDAGEANDEETPESGESDAAEDDSDGEESGEDADDDEEELKELGSTGSQKSAMAYSEKSFTDLGLGKWLVKLLTEYGMQAPTPVQANCIPKVLEGSDVLGCAKTGTGKTLAFALPILQKLVIDPYGVFALVLTPTRELAYQIADQFKAFGRPINLKLSTITGGMGQTLQANELARQPHIVVATPGRLADLIQSDPEGLARAFKKIQFLVLDEGDQMLDGPYGPELAVIFKALPKKRQTLLFSATITSALTQLHQVSVSKPYFFEDVDEVKTVEKLEQRFVLCPVSVKDAYLVYVVKSFYESRSDRSILIFAQTCRECQALALMFQKLGFQAGSLHSLIPQKERNLALTKFRSKELRILLCTDVASRGLDIPHVDLVVNHNIPRSPKTYVHRVGRSARAGRFGSAVTFCTQYDIGLLREVEALVGRKMDKLKVNSTKVSKFVTDVLLLKREAEIKLERQKFGEKREIHKRTKMALEGLDEEQIEEAVKMQAEWRKKKTQKLKEKLPEAPEPPPKKTKKVGKSPAFVDSGKKAKVRKVK